MENHINLFGLFMMSNLNDGLGLINKLQLLGALPTEEKCIRGHQMKLVKDQSSLDKFKWNDDDDGNDDHDGNDDDDE